MNILFLKIAIVCFTVVAWSLTCNTLVDHLEQHGISGIIWVALAMLAASAGMFSVAVWLIMI